MKTLITGASGQLGRALAASAPHDVRLVLATHAELDIGDLGAVRRFVSDCSPDVIVNAAAYTDVDSAESDTATAFRINGDGPGYLAEAVKASPTARLIHVSTDYVFDGTHQVPYLPADPGNPLNLYGHSKLEGERQVDRILGSAALVIRTAWVYAPEGRNFVRTMLRLMRTRDEVRVVVDQYGTPTAAVSVAQAIWRAIRRPDLKGVLHWTDEGVTSWHEFACAIADLGCELGLLERKPGIVAISTEEFGAAARRPRRSVLDLQRSARELDMQPIPWRANLRQTLMQIHATESASS